MAVSGPNSCRARGLFVGLATVDLLYMVDDLPPRNAKISVPGQHIAAGGPATNAAVTFAFLGGSSALVTAVGQHPLGSLRSPKATAFPRHNQWNKTPDKPVADGDGAPAAIALRRDNG